METEFGLLATGSSGSWSVDLDESPNGSNWSLQIDGPQVYVAFALRNPEVIRDTVNYLRCPRGSEALCLGQFDRSNVSLHWDSENTTRCFLIVSSSGSAVRVTLLAEDIASLLTAFEQVLADLAQPAIS
jgi:hypothetical protein